MIKGKANGDVSGSPYLFNYWSKGTIKTSSGKIQREMSLKFDVSQEKLLFQTSEGDSMYFAEPIDEFELLSSNSPIPLKFTFNFPASYNIASKGFIQNISTGKISLYKKYNISIMESKGYGAQSVNKNFNPTTSFFIFKDGSLTKFFPSKKNVLVLIPNKEAEITEFMKKNTINFKTDEDLKKVFDFINQL